LKNINGWIIYRKYEKDLNEEDYEIKQLLLRAELQGMELQVIKPDQISLLVGAEKQDSIFLDGHAVNLPDFILPRMGACTTYYGLALIKQFQELGVTVINTSAAIACAMDKFFSQQLLVSQQLPVPKTILARFPLNYDWVEKLLGFPLIVKTITGSLGKGVCLLKDKNSFIDLMQLIELSSQDCQILLQEFVAESSGRDLRVFVIGDEPIACMLRIAVNGGFKANYSLGGKVEFYQMNAEIRELSVRAAKTCGLDIAGVDLLFGRDGYKICEVNSSPGFKGLESCCDLNIADEIMKYIRQRVLKNSIIPQIV